MDRLSEYHRLVEAATVDNQNSTINYLHKFYWWINKLHSKFDSLIKNFVKLCIMFLHDISQIKIKYISDLYRWNRCRNGKTGGSTGKTASSLAQQSRYTTHTAAQQPNLVLLLGQQVAGTVSRYHASRKSLRVHWHLRCGKPDRTKDCLEGCSTASQCGSSSPHHLARSAHQLTWVEWVELGLTHAWHHRLTA